jgi:hypothetical protein
MYKIVLLSKSLELSRIFEILFFKKDKFILKKNLQAEYDLCICEGYFCNKVLNYPFVDKSKIIFIHDFQDKINKELSHSIIYKPFGLFDVLEKIESVSPHIKRELDTDFESRINIENNSKQAFSNSQESIIRTWVEQNAAFITKKVVNEKITRILEESPSF